MKTIRLGGSLLLCLLATTACGAPFSTDQGAPVPPPPVTPDRDTPAPAAPASSGDDAGVPSQNPPPVMEGAPDGIFVSASRGTNEGDGAADHPLRSVQAGIEKAAKEKKNVIVCAETYAETITMALGVSVYGNFDCAGTWMKGAARARLAPASSPVVIARGIGLETHIEGFEIIAPDVHAASGSSIALVAQASPALVVMQTRIHAGTAGDGAAGTAATQLVQQGQVDGYANIAPESCMGQTLVLCEAQHLIDHGEILSTCAGAPGFDGGPGGAGGKGGRYRKLLDVHFSPPITAITEIAHTAGGSQPGNARTAAGGMSSYPFTEAQPGFPGANGGDAPSATRVGVFTLDGYAPAAGAAGTNGLPGQGGGGGSGRLPSLQTLDPYANGTLIWGAHGPSGGAGGCPGLAGTAGGGGGASVAILAFESPMQLAFVDIETSLGGAGGKGTLGSSPTRGGAAGMNVAGVDGKSAAPGGAGGRGGNSGSGAGGPSIGIAHRGTAPSVTSVNVMLGTQGRGVPSMTHTDGRVIDASADGVRTDTYAF